MGTRRFDGSRVMKDFVVDAIAGLRSVIRQPRRSAMGFVAVGGGVVAFMLAAGFVEWMFWGLREGTIRSGLGHVQVVRAGYRDGGRADPYRYLLSDDPAIRRSIEVTPGVVTVAPRLAFAGLASLGDTTVSFIGEGLLPEREGALADNVAIVDGEALSSDDAQGIVLGQGLAAALRARVGDTIVMLGNTGSGGVNAVEGRVRGLFSTVTKAYDDSALRVTLPMAQRLMRASGSHVWVVLLDDTDQTSAVAASIRGRLDLPGLEVTPWYELADFYNKTVTLLSRQIAVLKWMIAIIIVLGISNTLMMNVMERTGEIGTSMALGLRRLRVLRRFVAEGVAIGVLGGAAGALIGWLLALAISRVGIPMPPPPGMSRGYVGEIMLTWPILVDSFMLAVGTTLLASALPAWKASRMNVVDALRRNR